MQIPTHEGNKPDADDMVNLEATLNMQKPLEHEVDQAQTPADIPVEILLNERINAKLFQFKLKRLGVALSLCEIFTLFEHLNTQMAKLHYEP